MHEMINELNKHRQELTSCPWCYSWLLNSIRLTSLLTIYVDAHASGVHSVTVHACILFHIDCKMVKLIQLCL